MSPILKRSSTKTRKKTAAKPRPVSELAVGFTAGPRLNPQDTELFRAFQSNLLSLLSHELKTPLTGILNSLSLLSDQEDVAGISRREILEMAYRNAQRLNHALSSLLDLAALESGTFHVKLREVDLPRLVRGVTMVQEPIARVRGLSLDFVQKPDAQMPALADPHKLGRAFALAIEVAMSRAKENSRIRVESWHSRVEIRFALKDDSHDSWKAAWSQALVGREGRAAQALSAFAGALQMESEFLARKEEGLGSELLLIHEILRLHQGVFELVMQGSQVTLVLSLPDLNSIQSLKAVLSARSEQISSGIGSVALSLLRVPKAEEVDAFRHEVKAKLFRTTDAVYPLPSQGQVAIVMDDCSPQDAVRLVDRIQSSLGKRVQYGIAVYPQEAGDSDLLIRIASERLKAAIPGGK